jgi:predicted Rdx family selenoprotein
MILWRDPKPKEGFEATYLEIIKQDGNHIWYRQLDGPNKGDIHECVRDALDPDFYEITKAELVKKVLKL